MAYSSGFLLTCPAQRGGTCGGAVGRLEFPGGHLDVVWVPNQKLIQLLTSVVHSGLSFSGCKMGSRPLTAQRRGLELSPASATLAGPTLSTGPADWLQGWGSPASFCFCLGPRGGVEEAGRLGSLELLKPDQRPLNTQGGPSSLPGEKSAGCDFVVSPAPGNSQSSYVPITEKGKASTSRAPPPKRENLGQEGLHSLCPAAGPRVGCPRSQPPAFDLSTLPGSPFL